MTVFEPGNSLLYHGAQICVILPLTGRDIAHLYRRLLPFELYTVGVDPSHEFAGRCYFFVDRECQIFGEEILDTIKKCGDFLSIEVTRRLRLDKDKLDVQKAIEVK